MVQGWVGFSGTTGWPPDWLYRLIPGTGNVWPYRELHGNEVFKADFAADDTGPYCLTAEILHKQFGVVVASDEVCVSAPEDADFGTVSHARPDHCLDEPAGDAGSGDAGAADVGSPNAGAEDTGVTRDARDDAQVADASTAPGDRDAGGEIDANTHSHNEQEASGGCSQTPGRPGSSWLLGGLCVLLLARRRFLG